MKKYLRFAARIVGDGYQLALAVIHDEDPARAQLIARRLLENHAQYEQALTKALKPWREHPVLCRSCLVFVPLMSLEARLELANSIERERYR